MRGVPLGKISIGNCDSAKGITNRVECFDRCHIRWHLPRQLAYPSPRSNVRTLNDSTHWQSVRGGVRLYYRGPGYCSFMSDWLGTDPGLGIQLWCPQTCWILDAGYTSLFHEIHATSLVHFSTNLPSFCVCIINGSFLIWWPLCMSHLSA